ncbi:hypothetical protein AOLI_G00066360 [Acnodon oligacanthus]
MGSLNKLCHVFIGVGSCSGRNAASVPDTIDEENAEPPSPQRLRQKSWPPDSRTPRGGFERNFPVTKTAQRTALKTHPRPAPEQPDRGQQGRSQPGPGDRAELSPPPPFICSACDPDAGQKRMT